MGPAPAFGGHLLIMIIWPTGFNRNLRMWRNAYDSGTNLKTTVTKISEAAYQISISKELVKEMHSMCKYLQCMAMAGSPRTISLLLKENILCCSVPAMISSSIKTLVISPGMAVAPAKIIGIEKPTLLLVNTNKRWMNRIPNMPARRKVETIPK